MEKHAAYSEKYLFYLIKILCLTIFLQTSYRCFGKGDKKKTERERSANQFAEEIYSISSTGTTQLTIDQ